MQNYKTLIILDWDDTLFPTSWLSKNNINLLDIDEQNKYIVFFSRLDNLLYKLFLNMIKYGQIVIITNATQKWIHISSNIIPNTQKIIQNRVPIISAKDTYEKKYPMQTSMWKKLSFKNIISDYFKSYKYQNRGSLGDADHEFYAMTDLYDEFSLRKIKLLKTVRFIKDPSHDSLIDQLEVIDNSLHHIITAKKHMDLNFNEKN